MLRFLGLMVLGAVIAYVGDRIGTRIGKKRLSILGLRPKNTAVIVTVVTGMLITATILGVSSLLVPNVRLALTEDIEEIKTRTQQMEKDYSQALAQQVDLVNKVGSLESQTKELESRRERLEANQKAAILEVETLRQEKLRIDAELAQNLLEERDLRDQLGLREQELRSFREAIEAKNLQIDESRTELTSLNLKLSQMREEARKALDTIAELSSIIEQKETKRIVLHHMEPLLEQPIEIRRRLNPEDFFPVFEDMLAGIKSRLLPLKIEPLFIESADMTKVASEIQDRVLNLFDEILAQREKGMESARGVLIFPLAEHNVFAQEALEEARFLVIEDRLLIRRGHELQRVSIDTSVPAEDLLRSVFEIDDQIKKQMFAQGVLGNPFKARTPKQIIQFARFVDALKNEAPSVVLSIVADDDIYASGNFAFRYNILESAAKSD